MSRRRLLLGAGLVLALSGCGHSPTPEQAAAASPPPHEASPVVVRGTLAKTEAGFALTPCGSRETPLRLEGTLADVESAWASLGGTGREALAAEIRGVPSGDGALRVTDLVRARSRRDLGCDVPVFDGDYVASGNEPFWSVEVRHDAIVFKSPEIPKGRSYPYSVVPSTGDGTVEFATKIDAPAVSTLSLRIRSGRCVDSMSGEVRSFKARAEIDGKALEGCAAAGVPQGGFGDDPLDELERYAGGYAHESGLWRSEPLASRLKALLGAKLAPFEENLRVASALSKEGGVYYLVGNKPHQGGNDFAVFVADPDSDTINVVLYEGGHRTDFREGDRELPLPKEAEAMLKSAEAR